MGFCLLVLKQAMELRFESITRWLATPSMDMRGSQYLWACRTSRTGTSPRPWSHMLKKIFFEGEHGKGGHFATHELPDGKGGPRTIPGKDEYGSAQDSDIRKFEITTRMPHFGNTDVAVSRVAFF
ncbi:hypothetical protein K466DRAFT_226815 [Polyporus arcularius HHB13444]|uniref:Uncharacterized protein n=1 Tax=Polyporus arcularius HHB13444 TaxID=1314778 RepID=A0A5C3P404_9APHY|nr:hypothetical protein K466DRAFT_226815 [Polyporus arcularius HHB13444]